MTQSTMCTVVVSSFDGFADCWAHFEYGLTKYWPDCPWTVVLLTGRARPEMRHLDVWPMGEDLGWAANLKNAIGRIESEYILYLQEDYWLSRPVDTARLVGWLELMHRRNWQYLRLNPCPPPERLLSDCPDVGECVVDSKYRVSLQAAFWNRHFLDDLLYVGEDGWDFESRSMDRLKDRPNICFSLSASPTSPNFSGLDYCAGTAVRRGQWTRGAVEYARREKLDLNPARKQESQLEEFLSGISRPLPAKAAARTGLRLLQVAKGQRHWRDFFV